MYAPGVPKESVLGRCPFLYYINDIPDNVKSKVRLFADVILRYLVINSNTDASNLQRDLDQLAQCYALNQHNIIVLRQCYGWFPMYIAMLHKYQLYLPPPFTTNGQNQ